jgi:sugar/nucleoside kinase (ribokinase family)
LRHYLIDYIEEAEVFIYGSVSLATRSRDAALKAAQLARVANHHVIFDVNLRPALWKNLEQAKTRIETALTTATIIKVNEVELEFLTGTRDVEKGSQHLLTRGAELCCVSLGKDGAFFVKGKVTGHVPAFAVQVKSTVGSGDAFVAGLAFQLSGLEQPLASLSSIELTNILRFANACGAIVATQEGAMSAELSIDTVKKLVERP